MTLCPNIGYTMLYISSDIFGRLAQGILKWTKKGTLKDAYTCCRGSLSLLEECEICVITSTEQLTAEGFSTFAVYLCSCSYPNYGHLKSILFHIFSCNPVSFVPAFRF